ncbi:LysM peptidoglycan-binding domain-containing protein [Bacillus infantis]|uniref:LysM peptidoglycan-binding domain-containing protein n=1 Tax=Bacillus infantis TaxID=324767 RepID=UPI003CF25506
MEHTISMTRKERIEASRKNDKHKGKKKGAAISLSAAVTLSSFMAAGTSYAAAEEQTVYSVKKGDSLYKIARTHDVSVSELKTANNLNANLIFPGQELEIPEAGRTEEPSAPDQETPADISVYTVQAGDTLWELSQRFQTSIETIKRLNGLNSNFLLIGQKLIIHEETPYVDAQVVGAADNFTVEFKTEDGYVALKVAYGTAQDYQKLSGQNVSIAYKDGALVSMKK